MAKRQDMGASLLSTEKLMANMFMNQEQRDDEKAEKVREIPLADIDPFPKHTFQVRNDESLQAMAGDIKLNGVQQPVVVRSKEDGRCELVIGHRRKRACELAGLETMPCFVREMNDEEATLIMGNSNIHQRETIYPSERARTYKVMLDALKRQAGRPGKDNLSQLGTNYRADEELAKITGESRSQIHRYIRLLDLISPFLEMMDESEIAMSTAEALLQIPREGQSVVCDALKSSIYKLDTKKAEALRRASQAKPLDRREVELILSGANEPKKTKAVSFRLKPKLVSKYFKPEQKSAEIESIIIKALDFYNAHHPLESGETL